MKKLQYTVKNSLGIHARPAALLAQACTNFKSAVMVECNGNVASGNNVLQILLQMDRTKKLRSPRLRKYLPISLPRLRRKKS